jgi:SAM-dependent methyltransferase
MPAVSKLDLAFLVLAFLVYVDCMQQVDVSSAVPQFPNRPWRNGLQSAVEVPLALRLLRAPRNAPTLELGCGRGIALESLWRVCAPISFIGVDLGRVEIHEARERARATGRAATFVVADIRAMPVADRSVGVVIDFGTCYHLPDPERALLEVQRVLTAGGVFIHETPAAQRLAHPRRTNGQPLPWSAVPNLIGFRHAGLWASRRNTETRAP